MSTWNYANVMAPTYALDPGAEDAAASDDPLWGYGERVKLDTHFAAGLYIISLIYSFRPGTAWVPVVYSIVWGLTVLVLTLTNPQRRIRITTPIILFGVWALWSLVCLIPAESQPLAKTSVGRTIRMLGLVFLALNSVRSLRQLRYFFYVLLLSEAAMIVVALVQFGNLARLREIGGGLLADIGEITGGIQAANDLALVGFLGVVVTTLLFLTTPPGKIGPRLVQAGGVLLSLYVIWTSGSRRQMLNVPIFFILVYCLHMVRGRQISLGQKMGMTFIAIILFTGILFWLAYAPFAGRLQSLRQALRGDFSALRLESRYVLMKEAFTAMMENPALGLGPGHFRLYDARYGMGGASAHSDIGTVGSETGFIGLAIYYSWWIAWLVYLARLRKRSLPPHHAAMVNCLFAFVFLTVINTATAGYYRNKFLWLVNGAIMGYCVMLRSWTRGQGYGDARADDYDYDYDYAEDDDLAEPVAYGQ